MTRFETGYAEALVESMSLPDASGEELRTPVTQVFAAGFADGLELTPPPR